jgi:hypothetical protein
MKTTQRVGIHDCPRKKLQFGDLIAAVYENCGKTSANGLLRLAVNANLVEFAGQQRVMIVNEMNGGFRF